MTKPTFFDIRALLAQVALPFYQIKRDMPLPFENHRNENDAEHSWSLAFLGCALAPEVDPALDVGKVTIFATLHDVVEVKAGDTSYWADQTLHDTKIEREKRALHDLTKQFPQFPNLFAYIHEYEQKSSNEALFVYALDKFLNMFIVFESKGYYMHKNKLTSSFTRPRLQKQRTKAHAHPVVARYYDALEHELYKHPEYFYPQE